MAPYNGPREPPSPLPKPGEVVRHDMRSKEQRSAARKGRSTPSKQGDAERGQTLRVATWNIERGYKLDAVIEEMRAIDADVIAVQV
eukprot:364616-Chlamydomonas_euryale.AAC.3